MKNPRYNPENMFENEHDRFKQGSLYCSEAMRATSRLMGPCSADAYNLSIYLATWWNDSTGNANIRPQWTRLSGSIPFTQDQFVSALEELERLGWWKAIWLDQGKIAEYKPLFAREEWCDRLKARVKARGGYSMNHGKFVSRYTKALTSNALAVMNYAVSETPQLFNNLGNDEKGFKRYFVWSGNKKAKLCHGTYFDHPMVRVDDPEGYEALAAAVELPEEWTRDKPTSLSFSLADLNQRVIMSTDDFAVALEEVHALGYWSVEHHPVDPFGDGRPDEDVVTLTPTYLLHSMVWELDYCAGGAGTNGYELRYNMGDKRRYDLPPLGYHFIYALRSHKTGKVVSIGETTQSMETRLNQHRRSGTNADAHAVIRAITQDPEDTLIIEHLATVFFPQVPEYEMTKAHEFIDAGHPLTNKVLDVRRNRRTVKADRRFGELLHNSRLDDFYAELGRLKAAHGGQTVLFEANRDEEREAA